MACQIKKKKPAKWKVVIPLVLLAVVGIWYWHEKSFQQLKTSGEDIYFLEYESIEADTIIYQYDVTNDKVISIGKMEGYLFDCYIDRDKNCIIGVLSKMQGNSGEKDDYGIIKYDLSNGKKEVCLSTKEIEQFTSENTSSGSANFEEESNRISFLYDGIELQYNLEEHKIEIEEKGQEVNEKIVFFQEDDRKKLYLYNPEKETTRCIVSVGWNRTIGTQTGWDQSGNYLLCTKNFWGFFNAKDVKVVIRNVQSGAEKVLFKRKNTYNQYEFVQEM